MGFVGANVFCKSTDPSLKTSVLVTWLLPCSKNPMWAHHSNPIYSAKFLQYSAVLIYFIYWIVFIYCCRLQVRCHLETHLGCCGLQTEAHIAWPPIWLWCTWASHLCWDYAASPQQAPCNVCQQSQCHWGKISRGTGQGWEQIRLFYFNLFLLSLWLLSDRTVIF